MDRNKLANYLCVAVIIFFIIFYIGACSGSSHSSNGKKWEDLSEQEKQNARDAYKTLQEIKEQESE